jgi:hypothetical protein
MTSSELATLLQTPAPPAWDIATVAPGIYEGVSAKDYHRKVLGIASKHMLEKLLVAPAKYKAYIDGHDDADTDHFRAGRAFETALLEPGTFAHEWAIEPDYGDLRTKGAQEKRKAFRAAHPGREYLSDEEGKTLNGMLRACRQHPLVAPLLTRLDRVMQPTLVWNDPETGLRSKCRPDLWLPGLRLCIDLKTTKNASPWSFAADAARYTYHHQEAHYRDGFAQVGHPIERFLFLAIEKEPPYLLALYELTLEDVEKGSKAIARGMRLLADCVATDRWPGLSPHIEPLPLPRWAAE